MTFALQRRWKGLRSLRFTRSGWASTTGRAPAVARSEAPGRRPLLTRDGLEVGARAREEPGHEKGCSVAGKGARYGKGAGLRPARVSGRLRRQRTGRSAHPENGRRASSFCSATTTAGARAVGRMRRSGVTSSACRELRSTGSVLWVRGPSGPLPGSAAPRSGDRQDLSARRPVRRRSSSSAARAPSSADPEPLCRPRRRRAEGRLGVPGPLLRGTNRGRRRPHPSGARSRPGLAARSIEPSPGGSAGRPRRAGGGPGRARPLPRRRRSDRPRAGGAGRRRL